MRSVRFFLVAGFVAFAAISSVSAQSATDAQVREMMIRESIGAYSGNCPCPYNSASNGGRCGGRSAYSRPGGASPLCYPEDITDEMVKRYRDQRGIAAPGG